MTLTPNRIFCWNPINSKYCRPMRQPGNITTAQIAENVSKVRGERVLLVQGWGDGFATLADHGLWSNGAVQQYAQQSYDLFHEGLLRVGIQLDGYFGDIENFPTTWTLTANQLAAAVNDSRWKENGGTPIVPFVTFGSFGNNDGPIYWPVQYTSLRLLTDTYMRQQWSQLVQECFVAKIRSCWNVADVGNYANQAGNNTVNDINGNPAYGAYVPIGNIQCPVYYGQGAVGVSAAVAYNYGVALFSMAKQCSIDRIIPWIPTNSGAGLLKDTPYYEKFVNFALDTSIFTQVHTVAAGVAAVNVVTYGPNAFLFNPNGVNGDADTVLIDQILDRRIAALEQKPLG